METPTSGGHVAATKRLHSRSSTRPRRSRSSTGGLCEGWSSCVRVRTRPAYFPSCAPTCQSALRRLTERGWRCQWQLLLPRRLKTHRSKTWSLRSRRSQRPWLACGPRATLEIEEHVLLITVQPDTKERDSTALRQPCVRLCCVPTNHVLRALVLDEEAGCEGRATRYRGRSRAVCKWRGHSPRRADAEMGPRRCMARNKRDVVTDTLLDDLHRSEEHPAACDKLGVNREFVPALVKSRPHGLPRHRPCARSGAVSCSSPTSDGRARSSRSNSSR